MKKLGLIAAASLITTGVALAHSDTSTHLHGENIVMWIIFAGVFVMAASLVWKSKP